jgi:hypothetical protein
MRLHFDGCVHPRVACIHIFHTLTHFHAYFALFFMLVYTPCRPPIHFLPSPLTLLTLSSVFVERHPRHRFHSALSPASRKLSDVSPVYQEMVERSRHLFLQIWVSGWCRVGVRRPLPAPRSHTLSRTHKHIYLYLYIRLLPAPLARSRSRSHARTHYHAHACMHVHIHTHTHTHTHTCSPSFWFFLMVSSRADGPSSTYFPPLSLSLSLSLSFCLSLSLFSLPR